MVRQQLHKSSLISLLRKWLDIILFISISGEILFFPSLPNLCGCLMTLIVYLIFRFFFLKRWIIILHPFSFLIFLSMFLARYIPLPATLLEGKPITYGFEVPFRTFFFETILFIVCSLAFYASIFPRKKKNNFLQRMLYRFHFFQINANALWCMGWIGLLIRVQQLSVAGIVEYGDVSNKFLAGLIYLQYAPLILLFPSLSGISYNKKRNLFVWIYALLIFIISFATNSRQSLIYPIFTIALLFFLFLLQKRISIFRFISPSKLFGLIVLLFVGVEFLSNVSLAMLANRGLREDVNRMELFEKTVATLQDEQKMQELRNASAEQDTIINYRKGWSETYLDNFMLNRFGNLRVSDQTLYYADKIGYGNTMMQISLWDRVVALLPTPILLRMGLVADKTKVEYSSGDMLYLLGSKTHRYVLGSYRVTSLGADGLATFGYFCYPIIFVLLYLSFKLVDCFVFYGNRKVLYSAFALMNIFSFIGMYRNSIGCINMISYLLRGFWQQCFTYCVVLFLIYGFLFLISRNRV